MAVMHDRFTSSITITDADGSELTLGGCTFAVGYDPAHRSAQSVALHAPLMAGEAQTFGASFTVEFDTSNQPHWSGRARHMWGLHTIPRNLGRSERQQDYRRGNSLARYYGRMWGETGLLDG